jgi:hypothetical protein
VAQIMASPVCVVLFDVLQPVGVKEVTLPWTIVTLGFLRVWKLLDRVCGR